MYPDGVKDDLWSMTPEQLRLEVLRLRAGEDLREELTKNIAEMMQGMRLRPKMYGRPAELEAMWHVLLWFEATLLVPRPTPRQQQEAAYKAREPIQRRHGWPGPLPLSAHGLTEDELMRILWEMRANYFQILGYPV